MEELRAIAEQTLAEARQRKAALAEEALQLFDKIGLDIKKTKGGGDVPPSSVEVGDLLQQYHTKVAMMNHQKLILTLEPHRIHVSEPRSFWSRLDARHIEIEDAWNSLPLEVKWNKEILITSLLGNFPRGGEIEYGYFQCCCDFLKKYWSQAPDPIRSDREVVLCRLSLAIICHSDLIVFDDETNHPYYYVPRDCWNDEAVVLVAVLQLPKHVLLNNILPERFLDNGNVFLAFLEGCSRYSEFTGKYPLEQDDEFRNLVRRFSINVRSNSALMLALVKNYGLCLHHVHESLKGNQDIIMAACTQNLAAIKACDASLQEQLLDDKTFVLQVLLGSRQLPYAREDCDEITKRHKNLPVSQSFYMSLSQNLQRDPDIVHLMLREGLLKIEHVLDETVPKNRAFWLSACHSYLDSALWQQLPNICKNDAEFYADCRFEDMATFELVLGNALDNAHILQSRAFWTAVINSEVLRGYPHGLSGLIDAYAPQTIRANRDLMLLACTKEAMVYRVLDVDLQNDDGILQAAIKEEDYLPINLIPKPVQLTHPTRAVQVLRNMEEGGSSIPINQVAEGLWSNLEVMKAYVFTNRILAFDGEDPVATIPPVMKDNEDFGIFAASRGISGEDFARMTSENLRSNKDVMMKAVSRNPRCLAAAVGDLSKDYDLAVMAFSHDFGGCKSVFGRKPRNQDGTEYDYSSERDFVYAVAAKARKQVVAYEGMITFLLGMNSNNPGRNCLLPMLSQDPDTAKGLKEKIVEYVGVPPVGRLRAASLNLLFMHTRQGAWLGL